jgi:hypothetical protein
VLISGVTAIGPYACRFGLEVLLYRPIRKSGVAHQQLRGCILFSFDIENERRVKARSPAVSWPEAPEVRPSRPP